MTHDAAAMTIGGRRIGGDAPLFVIAEIGLNHGGSLELALELVDAAAAAGASAIKLQTLVAAELVAPSCPAPAHVQAASLRDFFRTFELDERAHRAIVARARARGLAVLATPLCEGAVEMLERVGVDAYKIASGDITWTQLLERCAITGRPMVVATGMATLDEVARAVARTRSAGASSVALLHCVSAYPVPEGSENLRAIPTLAHEFGVPVGLSDHGADTSAVAAAVALGASIYERHFVRSHDDDAVDAAVSSTPRELADVIRLAGRVARALGSGRKVCLPAEAANLRASRRGLYASRALPAGHVIRACDIIALRPECELPPERQPELVGSTLTREVTAGMPFLASDIAASGSTPAAGPGPDFTGAGPGAAGRSRRHA